MATPSVPDAVEDEQIRETWFSCLTAAQARRLTEAPALLDADEIRSFAERIGPQVARRFGIDSPQVIAAAATLVTMAHPVALALLLAGHLTAAETQAARG